MSFTIRQCRVKSLQRECSPLKTSSMPMSTGVAKSKNKAISKEGHGLLTIHYTERTLWQLSQLSCD